MTDTDEPPSTARCVHCGALNKIDDGVCFACDRPSGGGHAETERRSRIEVFGRLRRAMASPRMTAPREGGEVAALIASEDSNGRLDPNITQELVALFDANLTYAVARQAFIRRVKALEDTERAQSGPDAAHASGGGDSTGAASAPADHLQELERLVSLRRQLKSDSRREQVSSDNAVPSDAIRATPAPAPAASDAPNRVDVAKGEFTVPQQIGKYEVLKRLRRGGMGSLFLGRDPQLDRVVAIKVIRSDIDSPSLRERFKQEARDLSRLRHPNVVTIHDYGEFESLPYLVMEYIEGESLADLIDRRPALSTAEKLRLVVELCDGLECVHRMKIVHRDLKPDNVMIDRVTALIKILDFGIARHLDTDASRFTRDIGTPCYMAPEQVVSGRVDVRTDIWAIGTILYELLSYERAFDGETPLIVAKKIVDSEPPSLLRLNPTLDPAAVRIVERTLRKDPSRRHQTVDELRRDVAALAGIPRGHRVDDTMAPGASVRGLITLQHLHRPGRRLTFVSVIVLLLALAWIATRGCV